MCTLTFAGLSSTVSIEAVLMTTAVVFIGYKVWTWIWEAYCRSADLILELSLKQKIEFLDTEVVRKKFTVGSQIGAVRYDLNLGYAKEALLAAQACSARNDWKGAYKALNRGRSSIEEYNIGHLPPRDMPLPRSLV
jgi:hypothetical protein